MTPRPVIVAITGAAGRVSYDLLFNIANGEMLGPDQPVALHLLDLPERMGDLEGRAMELHDCAFKTLAHVEIGDDPRKVFAGANFALLVGGKPRGPGEDRAALLKANGVIFSEHGRALNEVAADDVRILVTGNPANTNCAVARANAPDIADHQFSALTRLDHNRAKHRLGKRLGVNVSAVTRMGIWGNHSNTQFPDIFHAEVNGRNAWEQVNDMDWLINEFIPQVATRGAAVIKAAGASSAASAANATLEAMHDWCLGTPADDWVSMAVPSDGSYGVPEGLICSYPVTVSPEGRYHIVQGLEHNDFAWQRIRASVAELQSEFDECRQLGLL